MASRNYYSIPSNKSKKTFASKKTLGKSVTIDVTEKHIEHIREKKKEQRENKKEFFKNTKKIIPNKGGYKRNFLSSISILSEFAFNHPDIYPEIIAQLNKSFPSHTGLDYSKIFITYSQLITGKELTNLIDSAILQELVRFISKEKSPDILKKTFLSLERFSKKYKYSPQLAGYLNQMARHFHITAKF